jgi:hypothetical protein
VGVIWLTWRHTEKFVNKLQNQISRRPNHIAQRVAFKLRYPSCTVISLFQRGHFVKTMLANWLSLLLKDRILKLRILMVGVLIYYALPEIFPRSENDSYGGVRAMKNSSYWGWVCLFILRFRFEWSLLWSKSRGTRTQNKSGHQQS